jgi:hypothetical protein
MGTAVGAKSTFTLHLPSAPPPNADAPPFRMTPQPEPSTLEVLAGLVERGLFIENSGGPEEDGWSRRSLNALRVPRRSAFLRSNCRPRAIVTQLSKVRLKVTEAKCAASRIRHSSGGVDFPWRDSRRKREPLFPHLTSRCGIQDKLANDFRGDFFPWWAGRTRTCNQAIMAPPASWPLRGFGGGGANRRRTEWRIP